MKKREFGKDDILFLMQGRYGLRHIGSDEHLDKHLNGTEMGDAIPISRLDTLLTDQEKRLSPSPYKHDVIRDVAESLVDRFKIKVQEFAETSSVKFPGTSPHFMLIKNMELSADDQHSYPMGKAGRQDINPNQIVSHFSSKSLSAGQITDKILTMITDARLAAQPSFRQETKFGNNQSGTSQNTLSGQETKFGNAQSGTSQSNPLGFRSDDLLNNMQMAISMSLEPFRKGTLAENRIESEKKRLKNNLFAVGKHDPEFSANICLCILNHPKLDKLHSMAAKHLPGFMDNFAKKDPDGATTMAKVHLETSGGNKVIKNIATAFLSRRSGIKVLSAASSKSRGLKA